MAIGMFEQIGVLGAGFGAQHALQPLGGVLHGSLTLINRRYEASNSRRDSASFRPRRPNAIVLCCGATAKSCMASPGTIEGSPGTADIFRRSRRSARPRAMALRGRGLLRLKSPELKTPGQGCRFPGRRSCTCWRADQRSCMQQVERLCVRPIETGETPLKARQGRRP